MPNINPFNGVPYDGLWSSADDVLGQNNPNQRSRSSNPLGGFDPDYGVYNSFTGSDIVAYIMIPGQEAVANQAGLAQQTSPITGILGNIQTLSYSTFREVNAVRSLGKIYPDTYTRGPRTIAGTIIWTVMDQYVLAQALKYSDPDSIYNSGSILIDQIPPFSIVITMSNEYGDVASMCLYGIRMVNEGSTYSIDDMITEQTNTYVATGIDLLHKGSPFKNLSTNQSAQTGTSVLNRMMSDNWINNGGS